MQLHKKLNLPDSIIKEITSAAANEMLGLDLPSAQIHFLTSPVHLFNNYLLGKKIKPLVRSCMLFHRPGNYPQPLHIDCNNDDPPQLIKCAINIPIKNCEDSYMEWYSGDYSTSVNSAVGADGRTRKFIDLAWQADPVLLNHSVIDQPTLVRVNVPHKVSTTDQTRSLITLRFVDNPEFDDIAELF
jgi:hypothetical protein